MGAFSEWAGRWGAWSEEKPIIGRRALVDNAAMFLRKNRKRFDGEFTNIGVCVRDGAHRTRPAPAGGGRAGQADRRGHRGGLGRPGGSSGRAPARAETTGTGAGWLRGEGGPGRPVPAAERASGANRVVTGGRGSPPTTRTEGKAPPWPKLPAPKNCIPPLRNAGGSSAATIRNAPAMPSSPAPAREAIFAAGPGNPVSL